MIVVNQDKARAIAVQTAQDVKDPVQRAALLQAIEQAQTLDALRTATLAAREALNA